MTETINSQPAAISALPKKFIIVKGWHHSKTGGDDYPFERGFIIPEGRKVEDFKIHFEKKLNKKSAVPSDFVIEEVTEKKWNKQFKISKK